MSSLLEHHLNVSYRHRVAFTSHACDPNNLTLISLLSLDPAPQAPPPRVLITLDDGLARAMPDLVPAANTYFATHANRATLVSPPLILPGGETAKLGWSTSQLLLIAIQRQHIDRHSYVVAIGGGAFLDMAGFATAIAHRGCRHIRLPSTTLAQADSGVGIKNSLNFAGSKNFLGTFAPPWAVINDSHLLTSLSPGDLRAGLSEAVKVSLIRDRSFFEWLESSAPLLAALDLPTVTQAIRRSAELHLQHIATSGDPFELGSARPLDFGHWSAHKLEQLSHFELRHGEAVALGVALDTAYSHAAGFLDAPSTHRILTLLRQLGFSLWTDLFKDPRLLDGISEFREHLGGTLTLTLLRGIGEGFEVHTYDSAWLSSCLEQLRPA